MVKAIWIFLDENGDLLGFNNFKDAHKFAFEIYDRNLRFSGKSNEVFCYKNSWNNEDVYIQKLKMYDTNQDSGEGGGK